MQAEQFKSLFEGLVSDASIIVKDAVTQKDLTIRDVFVDGNRGIVISVYPDGAEIPFSLLVDEKEEKPIKGKKEKKQDNEPTNPTNPVDPRSLAVGVDGEGYLIDASGNRVLDEAGNPIKEESAV